VLAEFQRRARLYADLDRRLSPETRFYAAAALTNMVLAQLCVHRRGCIAVSCSTLLYLARLGECLEHVNVGWAVRIARGRYPSAALEAISGGSPAGLDSALVSLEQAMVDRHLAQLGNTDARSHSHVVRQIDRILNWAPRGLHFLPKVPCAHAYGEVLRRVTREVGRSLRFALREDRIRIGLALVGHASSRSQCAQVRRAGGHSGCSG
jgi:hypothetical protein